MSLLAKAARLNEAARRRMFRRPAEVLAPVPVAVDVPRYAAQLAPVETVETMAFDSVLARREAPDAVTGLIATWAHALDGETNPFVPEAECYEAATRNHAASRAPYGPEVTRVVLAVSPAGGQRVAVVVGRLSALHRAYPDQATLATWAEAGVLRGRGATLLQMELRV
jgi:hypothetical protein